MKPLVDHMDEEVVEGEATPIEVVELSEEDRAHAEGEEQRKREEMFAKLDAFGESLAKTRAEAIAARQSSGIEDEWLEDEEFYNGIDDANRGEVRSNSTRRQKPPLQAGAAGTSTTRSTVFPNITGPYTDAAAARIADMLLPTDDRSWALGPSPVPEMMNVAKGKFSPQMMREAAAMYPGEPKKAHNRLKQAVDEATQVLAEAKEKADKAQSRIEDWHVECQWHAQIRLVIEDSARCGAGVLKGPIPVKKRRIAYQNGQLVMLDEIKPASKWIDFWNFYPDAACGENIHNGSYTWERDYLTRKQLRELRGSPDYIDEQIDACLAEGPTRAIGEYKPTPDMLADPEQKDKFEIWYFHGTAEKDDLEAAGCDCQDVNDPHAPAMVVMVNNRVIKAALNPLDTGDFPYDVMVWRRRSGHWAGQGVARQIRVAQRIVTAATRNLMDNAGIAAGPMLVFRQGIVTPVNGVEEIAPRKMWWIAEDADEIIDATKAIGVVTVDMLVDELMAIIQLGLKLAEDVTGLPMLLQGQMGKAPDTVGGMQMLNNNASAVLRRLARLFDDRITEPHVRRYYYWLLQHGEDDEKGDYCVDARGSSALVERDLQNQAVAQMGSIVLDPRFGVDPKKWFAEFCKSQRLDAKRFEFDDEEWKKIVENMAKGPQDPRLQIAQMREESAERERNVQVALTTMEQKFEEQENEKDRQFELILAAMENETDGKEIKRKVFDTVAKLKTQVRLSRESNNVKVLTKPPSEPKGRAPKGQAFQR